ECHAAVPTLEPSGSGRLVRCIHPLGVGGAAALAGAPAPSPAAHPGSTLSVRDLTADYGGADILHGVNFEVPPGQCTAIVGESGSGKTTLARCLVGLHSSWNGEIRLGDAPLGRSASARTKDQLRCMQYIFQNPFGSLHPTMPVSENVEEPLRHFARLVPSQRR